MEWQIITREIKSGKDNALIIETGEQIDTVGNIYQKSGAVIPKACQNCKKEFKSEVESKPITQKVPRYKCSECDFENFGGGAALDHLITTKHKIGKVFTDRVVNYERTIVGLRSHITKTKDDILILCDACV